MADVFISTAPFGQFDKKPLDILKAIGCSFAKNETGARYNAEALAQALAAYKPRVLIAGTEPITPEAILGAPQLEMIVRVGIGLDNVPLEFCKKNNILVSYTPDAPSPAVAELTVGQIITLLRSIHTANKGAHSGVWHRHFGRRIGGSTVGIIGYGRIGQRVSKLLQPFNPSAILVNDIDKAVGEKLSGVERLATKEEIYKTSDILTLHVPLTKLTKDMIGRNVFELMKSNSILINNARGGIVVERDLDMALAENQILGAAMDVFEVEPYHGLLTERDTCLITCHMGSMTDDCRSAMEIEATREAVEFLLHRVQSRAV